MALALVLAGCQAPSPSPTGVSSTAATSGPLRVSAMTFNVLTGNADSSWYPLISPDELRLSARAPAIIEKIRLASPDIVGLQENEGRAALPSSFLVDGLSEYTWVHPQLTLPILVRTSRFEVIDDATVRITSADDPQSHLNRFVGWVQLRERDTGRTLFVFNVHTHPYQELRFARLRSASIDRLLTTIRRVNPELAAPFLITGDFNAFHDETKPIFRDHLTKLGAAGIVDSWSLAVQDASDVVGASSFNRMGASLDGVPVAKVVRRLGRHIDYVWVPTGTEVDTWAVQSGPGVAWVTVRGRRVPRWTGVVASDHSPVVAHLSFG